MPETVNQNLLIYRYAQAAIPSTLPPVGSGPLFDDAGQARFAFVGQQALLEGQVNSEVALPIGQDGKSALGQLAKVTWSNVAQSLSQKAADAKSDLKVDGEDGEEEARSWADTFASIRDAPSKLRTAYGDLTDIASADPLGQLTDERKTTPVTDGDAPV